MDTAVTVEKKHVLYRPYLLIFALYLVFLIFALILDSPGDIVRGLWEIMTSRSILVSDYFEIGGIGAALVNAVLTGTVSILLMMAAGVKPNGAIIMAIWLMTGFALFGKNLFNSTPIIFGVWLYARMQREPFINYSLAALLAPTMAPMVSELSFMGRYTLPLGIALGVGIGIGAGFVIPTIASFCVRVHNGYLLYNVGFAGGLICTFLTSSLRSVGLVFESERIWSSPDTLAMAVFMYLLAVLIMGYGLFYKGAAGKGKQMLELLKRPGRLVSDFYMLFGEAAYLNMGILCAFGTTLVLLLGAPLNGPTIGGIFTIMGFGCFGKHIRNITPVVLGAVLSTFVNMWDPTAPGNMLAILFSTGLAPIAGQFGPFWGVIAGFLHVNIANYIGAINSGLNLYNNGFAGGFVAMLLIPVIETFRRKRPDEV